MSHLLIVVGHLEKRLRCGIKTRKAKQGREREGRFVFFVGVVKVLRGGVEEGERGDGVGREKLEWKATGEGTPV
jgi:hypothetical protein